MFASEGIFWPLSLILGACFLGALVAKRVRRPGIVFYILLGLLGSNLLLKSSMTRATFDVLSSLGVILLLFTIGLELSLRRLWRAGKQIIIGALLQMVLTTLVTIPFWWLVLHNWLAAIVLGLALSVSSTAVVGKLLQERGEDSSLSGEITLSMLIIQDLFSVALITFLVLISRSTSMTSLAFVGLLLSKILVVVLSFWLFSRFLDFIFKRVALNREELSLLTFSSLFALVAIFTKFTIPAPTAGFLIGVILAHRIEQQEIFAQVRPLRDVLLVLFFFFLGTYVQEINWFWLVISFGGAVLLMLLKFLIVWLMFLMWGMHEKTAFWVGFDLMQIGEFAFIIGSTMLNDSLLNQNQYQLVILTITWSLVIFSLIYRRKHFCHCWFGKSVLAKLPFLLKLSSENRVMVFDQLPFKDHIVLCGYGRVGTYLGHGLTLSHLPLVVIDTDANQVKKLLKRGVKAIYGDATEPAILDYAQVDKAKFLIISVPSPEEQEQIILEAQRLNPKLIILARTHLTQQLRHFKSLGVQLLFQPEFEAAISMLKRILKMYDFDKTEIKKRLQYLKMEHGS